MSSHNSYQKLDSPTPESSQDSTTIPKVPYSIGNILMLSDLSGVSYYIGNFSYHLAETHRPNQLTILNVYSTSDLQLILDPYDNDERKEEFHSRQLASMIMDLRDMNGDLQRALQEERYEMEDGGGETVVFQDKHSDGDSPLVKMRAFCVKGDVVPQAIHYGRGHDLIVLGTEGANIGGSKRLFGGVASKMMHKCKRKLMLIVPIPEQTRHNGHMIWKNHMESQKWVREMDRVQIRNMVFCADLHTSSADQVVLDAMIQMAEAWNSELIILHVSPDIKKKDLEKRRVMKRMNSENGECTLSDDDIRLQLLKDNWQSLKQSMKQKLRGYARVKYVLLERKDGESVSDILEEWLTARSPGMVGLIKRKHGIFGELLHSSVCDKLAGHLKIPFLLYHE